MQTFDEFGVTEASAGCRWTGAREHEQWRRLGKEDFREAGWVSWMMLLVAPIGLAARQRLWCIHHWARRSGDHDDNYLDTTESVPGLPAGFPSLRWEHRQDRGWFSQSDLAKGIGQRLHLKLNSPDQRTITSATLNLRGWTAKGRKAQVDSSDDAALRMQTLTVPFTPSAVRTVSADVRVPGLTAVVSVELLSVKYSDGSTWTPPQGKTCRVAPDLLMVVAQR